MRIEHRSGKSDELRPRIQIAEVVLAGDAAGYENRGVFERPENVAYVVRATERFGREDLDPVGPRPARPMR